MQRFRSHPTCLKLIGKYISCPSRCSQRGRHSIDCVLSTVSDSQDWRLDSYSRPASKICTGKGYIDREELCEDRCHYSEKPEQFLPWYPPPLITFCMDRELRSLNLTATHQREDNLLKPIRWHRPRESRHHLHADLSPSNFR